MDLVAAGRLFIDVVNSGSFSAVAKSHGLNASSVSRQIKQLEQSLSVKLLRRSTRQLSVTEAGHMFYQRMQLIVADIEELKLGVSQLTTEPRGRLKISCTVGFGEQLLSQWISDFLQQYPEIKVELSLSDQIVNLIDTGIDVAIRLTQPKDSSLVAQQLALNQFYLCAAPAYLNSREISQPQDLLASNCLLYKQANGLSQWQFIGLKGELVLTVGGNFITSSTQSLLKAALQGLGIALLTPWSAHEYIESGQLQRVLANYKVAPAGLMNTGIYVVYPQREFLSLKTKVFIDFLKQKFTHL